MQENNNINKIKKPKPVFEVGMTYAKNGKYFIAVDTETLATYEKGRFITKRPYTEYYPCRGLPVDTLCESWKITTTTLDKLSNEFFTPKNCRDKLPSERSARRFEAMRESPIRVVKFVNQM